MLIPVLHCEKQVQLKDVIRFNAEKSVLIKGTVNPINSIQIRAGLTGTFVEVFNSNPKNWYLDTVFNTYAFDVDSSNNQIHFEKGGQTYSTEVPGGTYALDTLLISIKTVIEAAASPLTVGIAVDDNNCITFSPSQSLKLLPNKTSKNLLVHLGFKEDGQLKGFPLEYGIRKITLSVGSISESSTVDEYIKVYTAEGDALFSEDADLVAEENDIMKWLPAGHSSFMYLHRKAQKSIIDYLDRNGYRDSKQRKITKFAFVDNSDVREWSTYEALVFFFSSAQNQTDDVFKDKRKHYEKLLVAARDRIALSLDLNGDKKPELNQGPDIRTARLVMR